MQDKDSVSKELSRGIARNVTVERCPFANVPEHWSYTGYVSFSGRQCCHCSLPRDRAGKWRLLSVIRAALGLAWLAAGVVAAVLGAVGVP